MTDIILFVLGIVLGRAACVWACWFLDDQTDGGAHQLNMFSCRECQQPTDRFAQVKGFWVGRWRCSRCGQPGPRWPLLVSIGFGVFVAVYGWLLLEAGCQNVSEVRPANSMLADRLPFHLLFLFLMLTVTITDMLDYAIPDLVVWIGIMAAIAGATLSGDLQMIHVWVDWDYELVELYGPYLPDWMKNHQHLHGLVWSSAGLLAGAGIMWVVRFVGSAILGATAVGFGDITLMMMIGAFMGWQPVLCVLAIAPIGGLILGGISRIGFGRTFVAFGPYLTFSAVVVLCTWRTLWETLQLRLIFSHWPTVATLVLGSLTLLAVLLGALRIFKAVPAESLKR